MSTITWEHAIKRIVDVSVQKAIQMSANEVKLQQAILRGGAPIHVPQGGAYDENDEWVDYWKFGDLVDGTKPMKPSV
ncbi:hypothetical protein COW49_03225 [Candidatus Kaiserbacteria bacterium CG17_big_fil_post_rev_8_21_14_2_50_51_7]|uniref:Uncharacterized protein n=2 Tax=Candidatus Kaiseribacteriota TaxID=1752734 RepID=A0A2M7FBG1_9BACT|nr:MAG: hypothetical protein COT23_00935 [Candidatus Kaiserbacteria bacterium CG08_land_8_20_14_0_20_50_21]PIV86819.1 MAG: hypothetical protein COW49_03225 [Candidatus Kaiserbacteria bacterium CG17_big_fil_post_rev_8_21_14_2_50_51_7]